MPTRNADAEWKGSLKEGAGSMRFGSGAFEGAYSFTSRFEAEDSGGRTGTNPEELIAAAHAGCFSMSLSNMLASAGHVPDKVATTAKVHLAKGDDGFAISRIDLVTRGSVPGLDEAGFVEHAEKAKAGCPVSKALGAVEITLDAALES